MSVMVDGVRSRRGPLGVLAVSAVLAIVAACTTDYQKGKDDVAYGPPNVLAGARAPGPTVDYSDGEGGVSTSGPQGPNIVCVKKGGTAVDGGPCAVTFSTDVLSALGRAGCAQSSSCHGGSNPTNLPRIEPSDGPGMWAEFAAFTLSDGKAYINPCSTASAESGLACNLAASGGCGVHMPPGGQVPAADLTAIETWLACGAPNN